MKNGYEGWAGGVDPKWAAAATRDREIATERAAAWDAAGVRYPQTVDAIIAEGRSPEPPRPELDAMSAREEQRIGRILRGRRDL